MLFRTFPCTRHDHRVPAAILPVISRRTRRGPPVDGRTCNDHPNSSMCDTTTSGELSGRLPSDARSSGRQPVSPRSSDHFDIRHDQVATNERVSGRRPSDARSSGRLPSSQCFSGYFRIRHAGRPTSQRTRTLARRRRPGGQSPFPGDCSSRSAKLEDFSAGPPRDRRPPYSIESLAFLGRFLPRRKVGPKPASPPSRLGPHILYIVGCGISIVSRPDPSAGSAGNLL